MSMEAMSARLYSCYRYLIAGVGILHSCRWCRNEWECYSIELEFNDSAILWLSWTEIWGNWQLCGQEHQIAHRWWYYPFAVKSTQQGTHLYIVNFAQKCWVDGQNFWCPLKSALHWVAIFSTQMPPGSVYVNDRHSQLKNPTVCDQCMWKWTLITQKAYCIVLSIRPTNNQKMLLKWSFYPCQASDADIMPWYLSLHKFLLFGNSQKLKWSANMLAIMPSFALSLIEVAIGMYYQRDTLPYKDTLMSLTLACQDWKAIRYCHSSRTSKHISMDSCALLFFMSLLCFVCRNKCQLWFINF